MTLKEKYEKIINFTTKLPILLPIIVNLIPTLILLSIVEHYAYFSFKNTGITPIGFMFINLIFLTFGTVGVWLKNKI